MLIDTVIFLPLAAGVVLLLIPRSAATALKAVALAAAVATFALSLAFVNLGPQTSAEHIVPWINASFVAMYHVRVDGWSLFFVLLTTFVSVPAIWAAFSYADRQRLRGFLFFLLAFETTMLGLFTAGDLLLFYVYWDLMLVPVFILLVGYASSDAARRAAWGYLIYNGAGGLVLLLGIVVLVWRIHTFETLGAHFDIRRDIEQWLFCAFALAFLIKTPVFPFHAWMPATYTEAPPPLVAMVSGIQSKAGLYGFIVFALPLFPHAARMWAPAMLVLAVTSIVYGALTALGQSDVKTLVAYSSLSHLGLVLLALFAVNFLTIPASMLMIVSHGIIAAALFLLLGVIEERIGSRDLSAFGGLAERAPRLAACMLIASMALLGLPGLSGFAGEFLIFLGTWQTQPVYTGVALVVVVLASVYALKLFQGAMHGQPRLPAATPADAAPPGDVWPRLELRARELALLAPLLAAMFFLGVWPAWMNDRTPTHLQGGASIAAVVQR